MKLTQGICRGICWWIIYIIYENFIYFLIVYNFFLYLVFLIIFEYLPFINFFNKKININKKFNIIEIILKKKFWFSKYKKIK